MPDRYRGQPRLDRSTTVTGFWNPTTYQRTHGIRYFHGCYSLGDDQLWGVMRRRKGGDHTLAALKSIRKARPDGAPIYVILDNLSANKTPAIRAWATRNKVDSA
jgi:hypothetical protein